MYFKLKMHTFWHRERIYAAGSHVSFMSLYKPLQKNVLNQHATPYLQSVIITIGSSTSVINLLSNSRKNESALFVSVPGTPIRIS